MIHDPIGDLIVRVQNAQAVRKTSVELPFSSLKKEIAAVLKREGFISDFTVKGRGAKARIELLLSYQNEEPRISGFRRRSTPGQREYAGYTSLFPVRGGYGVAVLSTPHGVLSDKEARAKKVGGEIFFEIW